MRLVVSVFLLFLTLISVAQTRVTGKVFDADTREPLPFVNITFKGTKTGTTSDFEGNFTLSTDHPTDSIVVTYVGYNRNAKKITQNTSQTLNILLKSSSVNLTEVVVKAGENPAYRILRKVYANKAKNDRRNLKSFEYEVYNKIEFDVNNISKKFKERKLLKPFKFVFDNIDSSNVNEKPFLPIFMSESLSDYYYNSDPQHQKEVIKATKIAGLENESVSQVMGDMYQKAHIYDDGMPFFNKVFISPIADNGKIFYKYYLIDSVYIGNNRCYHIQFKPRRQQELTFSGNMWIADTSFAVKRIEMNVAGDANINFVNTLSLTEEFIQVDSIWMLSKERFVIDFALRENGTGIYGRKSSSYRNFVINKPRPSSFFSMADPVVVLDSASKKSDEYWANMRHDTLAKNEKVIYQMVDSIKKIPAFQNMVSFVTLVVYGYKSFSFFPYVEFGDIFTFYSYNGLEGHRFKLGGRTTASFAKRFELNGYSAYGTNDQKFKYGMGFRWMVSEKPREILSVNYKDDLQILGQSPTGFAGDNFLIALFRRTPLRNFMRWHEATIDFEHEWFPGLSNTISAINRVMDPTGTYFFQKYEPLNSTPTFKNHLITTEFKLNTRFAFREKYLNTGTFSRARLRTKYPTLNATYTLGIPGILGSQYLYHRITLKMNLRRRYAVIGYGDLEVEYGRFFNQVPYPIMEIHPGNETYFFDKNAFNLMNYGEFVSDEYLTLGYTHHFDGLIFNHFPLLRKLKLREVAGFKGVFGHVLYEQHPEILFPQSLHTLSWLNPYYEGSIGIENILKFFRVDMVYRLSYLNNPNISIFGIRSAIQIIF